MSEWQEPIWLVASTIEGSTSQRAALEGLAQARAIARNRDEIRVVLLTTECASAEQMEDLSRCGADCVTVVRCPGLSEPDVRIQVDTLAALLGYGHPTLLLIPASMSAEALAGRLAARMKLPVITGCIEARVSGNRLEVRREILKGALHLNATFELDPGRGPVVLALEPGSWPVPDRAPPGQPLAREVQVVVLNDSTTVEVPERGVARIRRILPETGVVDLADAHLVLAGGAGLGSLEAFVKLREVARCLGAAVGATRAAVDRGWARPEEQIGLTGREISPSVYIGFGISGAREHLSGMANARHIVAINTDPAAPIANVSQVFALADAAAVLAALSSEVRARSDLEDRG